MNALSLQEVAAMCGGSARGTGNPLLRTISKDTRTLREGDLYLALRGPHHDGNVHAAQAVKGGAAAVWVDDASVLDQLPDGFPAIVVPDSLAALHRLAASWRDRLAIKVVGITGSSGKTSTKEFTAAILSTRYQVTKTEGNLNNHIGVPLSILSASTSDDAAVWEIGMNHAGETAPLAALIRPDLAIVTNIGVAHIEHLGSREAIAEEKGALVEAVPATGVVILSAEDDFSDPLAAKVHGRVVRTGFSAGAVTASEVEMTAEGCQFLLHADGETVPARLAIPGRHMVANALLAVAAGIESGVSLEECSEALASVRLTGGRLARRQIRGITVWDDTYNANPDSMEAALQTLAALPTGGRRIAVLGAMGELGAHAGDGYRRVGRVAAQTVQILIAVGAETAVLQETASEAGLNATHRVADVEEAAGLLRTLAREGDVVLVKGSRGAQMERVIKFFEN